LIDLARRLAANRPNSGQPAISLFAMKTAGRKELSTVMSSQEE
jgi:hypothetical protein